MSMTCRNQSQHRSYMWPILYYIYICYFLSWKYSLSHRIDSLDSGSGRQPFAKGTGSALLAALNDCFIVTVNDVIMFLEHFFNCRRLFPQAQQETQKAALRYERAVSMHTAAREMVYVAEQGLLADRNTMDPTWQEMLNHATAKVHSQTSPSHLWFVYSADISQQLDPLIAILSK